MLLCGTTASRMTIRRLPSRLITVLLSVLVLAGSEHAWALYSVIYNGTLAHLATGANSTPGVTNPAGVAVDLLGNVYVADTGGNRIVEVSAAGTTSVLSITGLSPALNSPQQLTVDAAGNLYIADTGNNRIVKVDTSGNGTVVSTPSFTLSGPQDVAVDTSGDIFVTDTGNNRVIKVTTGGTASVFATSSGVALTSLSAPEGIATDTSGNVYIVDTGNNRVIKVTTALVGSNITSSVSTPSLNAPIAVSAASNGNVYVVDGPTNQRIVVIDPQGDIYDLLFDNVNTEFGVPSAIAQSANGTFYVADTEDDEVNAFQVNTAGFGDITLGTSSTPLTLNFSIGLLTTLNSVSIYTFGSQNSDFTIAANSGSPCTNGTGGLVNCTVNVQFTPTAAGLRRGALVLSRTDTFPSTTTSTFTVPLFGYGDGPVATLSPGVASVVNAGTVSVGEPFQTAYDGAGNIYVTSYLNSTLLKIPAGGGAGSVVTIPALPSPTGLQNPTGLAIDGAGNLFIADYEHNRIVELTSSGTSNVITIRGLSGGLSLPTALAFDGYGHLFVNDYGHGRIVMLTPDLLTGDGTAAATVGYVYAIGDYTLGTDNSTGIAVDATGNIYAPDEDNNRVIKVDPLGNESTVTLTGAGNLSGPLGVAVDPSGNLYVMDSGNARIIQKTTTGTVSVMKYSGPSLGQFIFGIAVDGGGNVLLSDFVNNRLVLDNVGQSAFTYPSTREFTNSATQTAAVSNLGDQPLVFSANPAYTASFSQDSSDENPCTSDTSLSSGQSCDVPIIFSPQAIGSLSANVTLTDNTQNVAGSTQQIAVSGTSTNPGDTTSTALALSPASSSYGYGQPMAITANVSDTFTGHTANVPTGSVTFTDTFGETVTQLGSAVTLNAGSATASNVVLTGIGAHSITANYSGVTGSYLSSTKTSTITLNQTAVTLSGPATQPVSVIVGQTGSVAITITPAYAGGTMPSGSISYSILNSSSTSIASGTETLTAGSGASTANIPVPDTLSPGTYTIQISYAGDGNYQSASTISISLTIGLYAAPAITLASSLNPALVTASITFTATVSSSAGAPTGTISFLDGSTLLGATAIANGQVVYTTSSLAAGVHSITASYSGDSSFSAGTSAALSELVQDFTVSTPTSPTTNAPTATVNPGGTATYSLNIGPSVGTVFPAPVTLSLTGLPPGATGALSPTTLPAGSSLSSVTLTIQLPQQASRANHAPSFLRVVSPIALGLLLLPFAKNWRRAGKKMRGILAMLLLLVGSAATCIGLAGCTSGNGFFAQAPTKYTITILVTCENVSHATYVTLNVE